MNKTLIALAALVSLGAAVHAVETETWKHASNDDFMKGNLDKLSLRSDGRLMLAPKASEIIDPSTAVLWAVAADSKGNIYAGGGGAGAGSAKLFRVNPAGESELVAELDGLQVQAIAVNTTDEVFAATAPDGKVYRISGGETDVFYAPDVKYIWAAVFDEAGNLYIGAGDTGEIHKITPGGDAAVFFRTEETHVRSLAIDPAGNLIAGTEPGGLIFRITPAGDGFVLHQSEKQEVTALAVAPDGSVYAAAMGSKKPGIILPMPVARPAAAPPSTGASTGSQRPEAPAPQATQSARPPAPPMRTPTPKVTGGSEILRIEPDGYPRLVWSDNEELVYALAFDGEGRLLFGTGNEGRIYRLDTGHLHTMLLKLPPTQVTALQVSEDGRLLAATSNVGKLYAIGPGLENQGSFEGEVLDAKFFSFWGRICYEGFDGGGKVAIMTRSGNLDRPQQNWSVWQEADLNSHDGRVKSPAARFLQYKVILSAAPDGRSPEVSSVEAAFMHKNVAPVVRQVVATPPNYEFPPQSLTITRTKNLTLPPLGSAPRPEPKKVAMSTTQTMQYAKGQIGVRWLAEDDNDDELRYEVKIRGEGESEWKLLEDDLSHAYLSWDSTAFADGEYRVRVTATDAPNNPPLQALSASLESQPFLIDNTPPEIEGLSAGMENGAVTASWRAVDNRTVITTAEYSLDGSEWMVVEPTTRLSDSQSLDYQLRLDDVGPGEHTLAVRVADQFENQEVAKTVFR